LAEKPKINHAAKSKDPSDWLEEHGNYLFRYALTRVRNREQAEDLVQETLLAGMRAISRFSGKSSIRTWLTSILKHKIIDYFRKSSRETKMDASEDFDFVVDREFNSNGQWVSGPPLWKTDPSQAIERAEFWEAYSNCLKELPPNHAKAFVLREIDGESSDEICKVLHITPSNLWVMLHRARMTLRGCLEKNLLKHEA
jgi:RNA polymerase sigma-70 factor (ECF subfamily)